MQDQDQRKYFSHATLTFVFTIASPNSRSSLIQLEVNKTQALYFCLSINRFGKPVSTLGASSAKTRFALLPEGMLFRRAVLGSARLQGSHVLLRRTGREQAV